VAGFRIEIISKKTFCNLAKGFFMHFLTGLQAKKMAGTAKNVFKRDRLVF
jgi:hypothetical protein